MTVWVEEKVALAFTKSPQGIRRGRGSRLKHAKVSNASGPPAAKVDRDSSVTKIMLLKYFKVPHSGSSHVYARKNISLHINRDLGSMENGHAFPPPFKKRKFYRRRAEDDAEKLDSVRTSDPTPPRASPESLTLDELITQNSQPLDSQDQRQHDISFSTAELLRQRKTLQRRKGGIAFVNEDLATKSVSYVAPNQKADSEPNEALSRFATVADRFAPQTGQVADVDQHMYAILFTLEPLCLDAHANGSRMAYIDSELAKRRQDQNSSTNASRWPGSGASSAKNTIDAVVQRQPAALGKLHEIDLGPDATLTNIARTEAAKRKLEGGSVDIVDEIGKVRLGRDGKPRRNRRRRNSDDVKRDNLVEEVLRETKRKWYHTGNPARC